MGLGATAAMLAWALPVGVGSPLGLPVLWGVGRTVGAPVPCGVGSPLGLPEA